MDYVVTVDDDGNEVFSDGGEGNSDGQPEIENSSPPPPPPSSNDITGPGVDKDVQSSESDDL